MMKASKMLKQLLLGSVILASLTSTAADAAWTSTVTITAIQISNGSVWIQISGVWPTNGGCSSYTWGVVPSTSGNFDLLTTTLYDAYVNGDSLTIDVSGCSTYPIITTTQLGNQSQH